MNPIQLFLADDDYEDRKMFMEALADLPIETSVTQFDNGVDLMADMFSENPLPQAIFLDLRMPLMDGFECLADIRSIPKFAGVWIVIYSTSYIAEEIDRLKKLGANQYIQKPNTFNQLKSLLYQSIKPLQDGIDKSVIATEFVILT